MAAQDSKTHSWKQRRADVGNNIFINVELIGHSGDEDMWDDIYEGTLIIIKDSIVIMSSRE